MMGDWIDDQVSKMMDRGSSRMGYRERMREAEMAALTGEARRARATVQQQEQKIAELEQARDTAIQTNVELAGIANRAIAWAVRLESELARYEYRDREYRIDQS